MKLPLKPPTVYNRHYQHAEGFSLLTIIIMLEDIRTPSSTQIPRDKFRNFAHKLVKELSGNYSVNKINMVESLNRKLAGGANFYQFTDYTAVVYGKLDRLIF